MCIIVLPTLYLKTDLTSRVLGVGWSNGAWDSQKNILKVDSDGLRGHPGPLTLAHLLRTFF